ncbi:hypothetical protein DN451_03945 [Lactobacillus reuteri]|nr:hypothetical protein [Limosilactobacillus reuteri]
MKIYITNNSIEHDTGKASLIKVPHSMKMFWLPDSLIYPGRGKYYTCYIPDGFVVTSAKSGMEIDKGELEEKFDRLNHSLTGIESVEHHTPDKEQPVHIEADDELKR